MRAFWPVSLRGSDGRFVVADDQKEGKGKVKLEGIKCVMKADAPQMPRRAWPTRKQSLLLLQRLRWEVHAEKDPSANQQLSDQAVHAGRLPVERRKCDAEQKVKLDGCEVCFCCPNARVKVEKAEAAAKSELLFTKRLSPSFQAGEEGREEADDSVGYRRSPQRST